MALLYVLCFDLIKEAVYRKHRVIGLQRFEELEELAVFLTVLLGPFWN